MAEQLYYEDVQEGSDITTLEKLPTTRTLVKWAGASGDYNELHYDKDVATGLGFSSVIVHGRLGAAFLTQMLTNWIGEKGELKKISVQYRGNALPKQKYICKGKVTRKYVEKNENCVECEIWGENAEGQKITPGSAVVTLPSKNKAQK